MALFWVTPVTEEPTTAPMDTDPVPVPRFETRPVLLTEPVEIAMPPGIALLL